MGGYFILKIQQSINSGDTLQLINDTCCTDRDDSHYTDSDDNHCTDRDDNKAQQVNCKGDKIENITQLLTHLGMSDIKHKCDDCDEESRQSCLKKEANATAVKIAKVPDEPILTEALLSIDELSINQLSNRQSVTHKLSTNKLANNRKCMVENKLILSSLFAGVFLTVMSL